ncbi:MAG: transglycosylase SLT domain-containing protein [Gemmatimonadaceae bacterium]
MAVAALAALAGSVRPVVVGAQRTVSEERYDDAFRKYTKRFFGPAFDWRYFKAQGMAESDLIPTAHSRVGARGIMQLMPGTFKLMKSARPEFLSIDDPEWNIAAGIMHDKDLWEMWRDPSSSDERAAFMFGSYNAGEGPIMRARAAARAKQLDQRVWTSVERVAPDIERWRYQETLGYVKKIKSNKDNLSTRDSRWFVKPDSSGSGGSSKPDSTVRSDKSRVKPHVR